MFLFLIIISLFLDFFKFYRYNCCLHCHIYCDSSCSRPWSKSLCLLGINRSSSMFHLINNVHLLHDLFHTSETNCLTRTINLYESDLTWYFLNFYRNVYFCSSWKANNVEMTKCGFNMLTNFGWIIVFCCRLTIQLKLTFFKVYCFFDALIMIFKTLITVFPLIMAHL